MVLQLSVGFGFLFGEEFLRQNLTFLLGIESLHGVQAVVHRRGRKLDPPHTMAILPWCHAVLPLKFPGKIAVIRKPGLHTYIQHFHIAGRNQLAGAVEPDGGNILLEALVHGVLDKPG